MIDKSRGTYAVNKQIQFKNLVLRSSLCDYSDTYILVKGNMSSLCDYSNAYILVKGNISVNDTPVVDVNANNTDKKVIFKTCAPFTDCITKINNAQVDNAIIRNNYSKTSGSLWQYCKDIPAVNNDGNIVDFNGANATDSFNFKTKITGQTDNNGRIDNVEIMVPLKYLSNFWRTLEMPLINCEVNLILIWSANCVIM